MLSKAFVRALGAETRLAVYRSPYIVDFPVKRANVKFIKKYMSLSKKWSISRLLVIQKQIIWILKLELELL